MQFEIQILNSKISNKLDWTYHHWMDILPDLSIYNILSFLDTKTLCIPFSLACKQFLKLSKHNYLWYEKIFIEFPFEELFEKFDQEKDWKSVYKRYKQSCSGRFYNYGSFLVGSRVSEENYNYVYQIKEDFETSKDQEVILYGGKPGGNLLFGHKRGDLLLFTQISGGLFYTAGTICKVLSDQLIYGVWYTNTKEAGNFISVKNNSIEFLTFLEENEDKRITGLFEEHKRIQSKNEYDFLDGVYKSTILWDPSKKEMRDIELEISKNYHENIGWIVTGIERKYKHDIFGILVDGICSMILTRFSSRYLINLFLDGKDKKSFKGYWYQCVTHDYDLFSENFLPKEDYPRKEIITCTKNEK